MIYFREFTKGMAYMVADRPMIFKSFIGPQLSFFQSLKRTIEK